MTMLSDSRILVAGGTVTSPMTKVERAEQARAAGQLGGRPKGVPRHETIAKDRPARKLDCRRLLGVGNACFARR
jgi:hypothetical protein